MAEIWNVNVFGSSSDSDSDNERPPNVPRVRILNYDAPEENSVITINGNHVTYSNDTFGEPSPASSPVTGESFCQCPLGYNGRVKCNCGEEDNYHEWFWDTSFKSKAAKILVNKKEVLFHVEYSCGTAAIRGNKPMDSMQYYWEIKMMTPVYGTDMMVGVGTSHVNFNRHRYSFVSLLGSDAESWGLSYTGRVYHQGQYKQFASQFGVGSIIGIHLNMWNGELSFFKNRKPLGVAYTGLKGKKLYPMVSSTAARSGMKVVRSCSFQSSLQFMCCCKLRQIIPQDKSVLDVVTLPPGLKAFLDNNLSWLLDAKHADSAVEDMPSVMMRKRRFSGDDGNVAKYVCARKCT